MKLVGLRCSCANQRRASVVDENGDPLPSRCCRLDDVYDARLGEEVGLSFMWLEKSRARVQRDVVCSFLAVT